MYYLIVRQSDHAIMNHHVGGDPSWSPPEGFYEVRTEDPNFNIGWTWDGTKAVDPDPLPRGPVPTPGKARVLVP